MLDYLQVSAFRKLFFVVFINFRYLSWLYHNWNTALLDSTLTLWISPQNTHTSLEHKCTFRHSTSRRRESPKLFHRQLSDLHKEHSQTQVSILHLFQQQKLRCYVKQNTPRLKSLKVDNLAILRKEKKKEANRKSKKEKRGRSKSMCGENWWAHLSCQMDKKE